MNIKYISYLIVICAFIAGCGGNDPAPDAAQPATTLAIIGAPAGDTVATINGEAITAPMLEVYANGRGMDPAEPAKRQLALDSLIENVLLAQDAYARGVAERPEVQAEVALVRLQQLAGRNLSEYRSALKITDEQIQAYYDQETARTGMIELNLKHLLFADEAAAMAAVDRALKPDADFDALIVEYGLQGAKQARDLGWANLSQLPPQLAEATKSLPDGHVAPLPVQTSFGWHVIKRQASRPFAPPALEQVKDGARKQLTDQALAEQVKALREKAKVEFPAAVPPQGN